MGGGGVDGRTGTVDARTAQIQYHTNAKAGIGTNLNVKMARTNHRNRSSFLRRFPIINSNYFVVFPTS